MANRKEVVLFSDAMEHKLRLKDYKGGWHDVPLDKLFDFLQGEVQELKDAVSEGNTFDIMAEAADVGNYAMMIMDNAIRRITDGQNHTTGGGETEEQRVTRQTRLRSGEPSFGELPIGGTSDDAEGEDLIPERIFLGLDGNVVCPFCGCGRGQAHRPTCTYGE
jgi:NTP pyrophosphatase (non-canonical NTP hydrolase)